MFSVQTLNFLQDLKLNNNKAWFDANKARYEAARQDFLNFVAGMLQQMGSWEEGLQRINAKDCVFRIYRDVRFSKDKTPYKTHFGAYMAPDGKQYKRGGYYFHLEPGNSFLGGGMWEPVPEQLKAIRQEIDYNLDEFKRILQLPQTRKYFTELGGSKLQKAPKDYPKDAPGIEYLKHKDFVLMHNIDDKLLTTNKLLSYVNDAFLAIQPLKKFLDRIYD